MRKNIWKHIRTVLAVTLTVAIAISLMPLSTDSVYGASFSTSDKVTGLKVSKTTRSTVTLKWDSYSEATGYEIHKATSKDGDYSKIKTTSSTSFKRTGLTTNKTCYYKVRAYKKKSDGSKKYSKFSSIVKGTPYGFNTKEKVSNFKVSSKTYNSVKLKWDSYKDATGYQIYKATSKDGDYSKIKETSSLSYNRKNLTTNKTCYYKVRAYKQESNGSRSYSKYTDPIEGKPTLGKPSLTVQGKNSQIELSWKSVSGANGYAVYRATSKDGSYSRLSYVSGTSYTDKSIEKTKPYYYKVSAYRTVNNDKKMGSKCSAVGMTTAPGRVSGVKAASKKSYIKLDWTSVKGATGYRIYRATGSSSASFTEVGSSTKNTFNDSNVATGVTYFYKVKAYTKVDGVEALGDASKTGFSRSEVVKTAVAWLGCKESNRSNEPIIKLYNNNMKTNFNYRTPWCAIFVSAVAIKSGTTDIIVRGSYCPAVINVYKNSKTSNYSYKGGSSYKPSPGDVIYFDWNKNGIPDHTGMVATVSGSTIKTIEGNKNDAVEYRTFSVGYRYVQGYGLPNYDEASGVVFTGTSSAVGCGELYDEGIGTEPEGYDVLGDDYNKALEKVNSKISSKEMSEYDKAKYIVDRVKKYSVPEGISCSDSQYYAAFIYKLCSEVGIDASILTENQDDGSDSAYIEINLDGEWYKIDTTKEKISIETYLLESTDINELGTEESGE